MTTPADVVAAATLVLQAVCDDAQVASPMAQLATAQASVASLTDQVTQLQQQHAGDATTVAALAKLKSDIAAIGPAFDAIQAEAA